jgi:23S rRNA (pseudouridine1915-N3)-methyltransferase
VTKINLIIIDKKSKEPLYQGLIDHYSKMIKPFAKLEIKEIYDHAIHKAQESSPPLAQASYSKALQPYQKKGFTIALDPQSKEVDSYQFAKLLQDRQEITLFIGGAYGFERAFVNQCDRSISFGKITLSHKLVKLVLLEQIFRGISINHNHPYHK